jgi:hypothetical protein
MSLTSDSSNATSVDGNLVVSSPIITKKVKKRDKLSETVGAIPCSMCDRKFLTNATLLQHKQDKHKVGKLIEVSSPEPTADSNDHSQPFGHGNPTNIDLIAFTDDDDCDSPQPNLLTTTTETSRSVTVSDDDSNTSGSSSELNDSIWLQTNSIDNEKSIEIDVAKHTEEDD